MKSVISFLLVFVFLTNSCVTNQVLVKFKNDSPEDFKKLEVSILRKKFTFENLRSGKTTNYIKVDKTYRYCWVNAITAKDTIEFLPIDYVGEELYTNGRIIMLIKIYQNDSRHLEIDSKRPPF